MEADRTDQAEDLSCFIDLDWFEESGRSFAVICRHCLCSHCGERLASEPEAVTPASLIANVKDCCSNVPGFIEPRLPLLEKMFRLLLSEGNRPLSLDEVTARLGLYVDNPASLTPSVLKRLLDNNQHYGFRLRPGED